MLERQPLACVYELAGSDVLTGYERTSGTNDSDVLTGYERTSGTNDSDVPTGYERTSGTNAALLFY